MLLWDDVGRHKVDSHSIIVAGCTETCRRSRIAGRVWRAPSHWQPLSIPRQSSTRHSIRDCAEPQ
jgi:hypothetical protein